MTLVLSNEDVEKVLTIGSCLSALEDAFRDLANGQAVNRPRSHTYTDLGGGHHYLFKSMDGSVARYGVHGIRMSSDHTYEHLVDGTRRREKLPLAPGDRWVGLIILFDLQSLQPLVIMQDGYLQRMRVGATSALAAKFMAREGDVVVGLIGSGWQAGAQLLALQSVRSVSEYRAYSPNGIHLRQFCDELRSVWGRRCGRCRPRETPSKARTLWRAQRARMTLSLTEPGSSQASTSAQCKDTS